MILVKRTNTNKDPYYWWSPSSVPKLANIWCHRKKIWTQGGKKGLKSLMQRSELPLLLYLMDEKRKRNVNNFTGYHTAYKIVNAKCTEVILNQQKIFFDYPWISLIWGQPIGWHTTFNHHINIQQPEWVKLQTTTAYGNWQSNTRINYLDISMSSLTSPITVGS